LLRSDGSMLSRVHQQTMTLRFSAFACCVRFTGQVTYS
jgi:hypothetical protein